MQHEQRLTVHQLASGEQTAGDSRFGGGGRTQTTIVSTGPGGAHRLPAERLAEEALGAPEIACRNLEMSHRDPHREPNLSQDAAIGALAPGADVALPFGWTRPPGPAAAANDWTPPQLAALVAHLATAGASALSALTRDALLDAWSDTVEHFRDPHGSERTVLEPGLVRRTGLAPRSLAAALEVVLAGVSREPARRLFARAVPLEQAAPALVVLAGNLPALGLQPLLPALALRRPLLLKSPSAEPLFLPAFVRALATRLPAVGEAIAALCWRGGDPRLEAPVLAGVDRVLAYGDAPALADLTRRAPGRVLGYGPKASLALVGVEADLRTCARGLARDIALFDQRGCLSVHAVYCAGAASELAERLAGELAQIAGELPPGEGSLTARAAVRQARDEAALRGLETPPLDFSLGTVLVEPRLAFRPSPGLRTVRIHPVGELASSLGALECWNGRLQGVALAGASAWALRAELERLGCSRFAEPGELQSVDAAWANGGIDPLVALG